MCAVRRLPRSAEIPIGAKYISLQKFKLHFSFVGGRAPASSDEPAKLFGGGPHFVDNLSFAPPSHFPTRSCSIFIPFNQQFWILTCSDQQLFVFDKAQPTFQPTSYPSIPPYPTNPCPDSLPLSATGARHFDSVLLFSATLNVLNRNTSHEP